MDRTRTELMMILADKLRECYWIAHEIDPDSHSFSMNVRDEMNACRMFNGQSVTAFSDPGSPNSFDFYAPLQDTADGLYIVKLCEDGTEVRNREAVYA